MRMTPDQILLVQTSFAMTGADGSALAPGMPWQNASRMTDDDLSALYAYLKAPMQ
jgi:hypothetical protein